VIGRELRDDVNAHRGQIGRGRAIIVLEQVAEIVRAGDRAQKIKSIDGGTGIARPRAGDADEHG
jgi:hypothetical protein